MDVEEVTARFMLFGPGSDCSCARGGRLRCAMTAVLTAVLMVTGVPAAGQEAVSAGWAAFPGPGKGGEVCLAFVGDLMHHCVQGSGAKTHPDGVVAGYAAYFKWVRPVLDGAHVAIGNLETPLDRAPVDCYPRFRAPPEYGFGIKAGGIDVVSLANNHASDYGSQGLDATIRWLKEIGLVAFGATRHHPYVGLQIGAVKVGLVSFTMLNNRDCTGDPCPLKTERRDRIDQTFLDAIAQARADNHVVVVYLHWMREDQVQPRKTDEDMAVQMLGMGADAVIGTHSHVLGTASWARVALAEKTGTGTAGLPVETVFVDGPTVNGPTVEGTGRRAYVRYGLGNFVSGMKRFPVRVGGVETVCFGARPGGEYEVTRVDFVSTYVRRDTYRVRSRTFEVVPLKPAAAQCRTKEGPFPEFSAAECRDILRYEEYYDATF